MYSNYAQAPTGGGLALAGVLTSATEIAAMVSQLTEGPLPPAPQGVVIRGRLNVTGGATGGGHTIKCRRGSGTGGAQVGLTETITFPATTTIEMPYSFVDTAPTTGQYTVTYTAAGSNGTFNDGCIEVTVPDPGGSD